MLTCRFEDGGTTTNLRHAVTSMIVIRGNDVLLERRAPHMTCGGKIALPGGYIDRGERIVEAAMREVMEETGYVTTNPRLFLVNDNPHRKQEDRQNIEFVYLLDAGDKVGESDHEVSEVLWCPLDSLPDESEWAFDHFDSLARYREYLQSPCSLPILDFTY